MELARPLVGEAILHPDAAPLALDGSPYEAPFAGRIFQLTAKPSHPVRPGSQPKEVAVEVR